MERPRIAAHPTLVTALLLSASLTLAAGCKKAEEAVTPEVYVQAAHPERGDIAEQIMVDATLAPLAQAAISPKVATRATCASSACVWRRVSSARLRSVISRTTAKPNR